MSTDTFPVLSPPSAPADAPAPSLSERIRLWLRLRLEGMELTRWHVLAALTILLAISAYLRTRQIGMYYWIDEGLSVGIASHHLTQIPSLLGQDGSPPLYYLLLHVWMQIAGRGEVATHELSLIFALLTVPVAYWLAAGLFDRRAGLVCAALAAGVPYLNTYAQETRMYALMTLLALIASGSFLHAFVRRDRRYLPVFVVSMAASLYTHNWALFLAAMSAVAFLFCVRVTPAELRRPLWRDGLIALVGVAVLYAPWISTLIYQVRYTGAPWDLPPVLWSISQGLYQVVGGRGAATALLLAGGAGIWALRQPRTAEGRVLRRPGTVQDPALVAVKVLAFLGFGTYLLAWVYSKHTPAWSYRYFAVVVAPLILFFGVGLSRGRRLGMVALLLIACWWILDPVSTSKDSKSNVGAVAADLRHHLGHDPLVLSAQPEQVPTLAYYLPAVKHFGTPIGPVPDPRVVDWRDALGHMEHSSVNTVLMPMLNKLRPGQRVLLVTPTSIQRSPLYLKLIGEDGFEWSNVLYHDPAFKLLKVDAYESWSAGVAVRAALYVKL